MNHLLGYTDKWSVKPGDQLNFFVSCPNSPYYHTSLFRLRRPEADFNGAEFTPEPIAAAFCKAHRGRFQPIHIGSSALIPDFGDLFGSNCFTLAVLLQTTKLGSRQAIAGNWSESELAGFGLEISASGHLSLKYATKQGPAEVTLASRLKCNRWYFVAATVRTDHIRLTKKELTTSSLELIDEETQCVPTTNHYIDRVSHFTMGAWSSIQRADSSSWNLKFCYHFNGLLEQPVVVVPDISHDELCNLYIQRRIHEIDHRLSANWDFSVDIATNCIRDLSAHKRDGVVLNTPARGVQGCLGSSGALSWRANPVDFGAIHFHEDDLADAHWESDFSYVIPIDLPSGVYGVKATDGNEEAWMVFFVRPGRNSNASKVAVLFPTATYQAYLNHRSRFLSLSSERLHGRLKVLDRIDIAAIESPTIGLSTYDRHSDSSPVYYATRRRPGCNLRPTGHLWNFALDLLILNWLDHLGIDCDVFTDEDLHREGAALLSSYTVLITGSHPEYASERMLDGLYGYLEGGGRLMYLGGNGFYWRCSFEPEDGHIVEVRRSHGVRSWDTPSTEWHSSFSGERLGLWRDMGRPPQRLVGVGYVAQGFDSCSYYLRSSAAAHHRVAWIFDGVENEVFGSESLLMGGAAGLELDAARADLGTPAHALVIARSEGHSNCYELATEDVPTPHGATNGLLSPDIHSDIVFFETPAGGAVFSVGSIAYCAGLSWNCFDNDLHRITTNVLLRFLDLRKFQMP